jgi:hypothetical protein
LGIICIPHLLDESLVGKSDAHHDDLEKVAANSYAPTRIELNPKGKTLMMTKRRKPMRKVDVLGPKELTRTSTSRTTPRRKMSSLFTFLLLHPVFILLQETTT